jgi:hypothetical protein
MRRVVVAAAVAGVGLVFASSAGAASFSQTPYTLATYDPSHGVGSQIGSSSSPYNAQHPIALGDLNGDGKPDIVASDYEANTIYVLLNNGDGTFTPAAGGSTGTCHQPDSVAVGDFNNDQIGDVLVGCTDSGSGNERVELFPGDGHGGIAASPSAYLTGTGPIFTGNLDGDTDVVYNSQLGGACTLDIENFMNSGNQDAQSFCIGGTQYGSLVHWYSSACGGDEWLSFTGGSVGTDYNVSVFEGVLDANPVLGCDNSSNTDHDSGIPCCSSFPNGIGTADLNGDGIPDIVMSDEASNSFHTAAVSTQSGLSVGSPTAIPSVKHISAFGIADFDGDGKPDLAGAEWGSPFLDPNVIAIHQGQGSTSQFGAPQAIPVFGDSSGGTYPRLVVGDLNGDGKPDIVTDGEACNEPAETACSTQITVMLNTTEPPAGGGGGGSGPGPSGGGPAPGGSGTPAGGPSGGAVFPGVKLLGGTFVVKKGAVKLKVTCPPSASGQCMGIDTMTTIKAFAVAVRRKHKVTLGSARFSIPSGQTRTLTIKLGRKGRTLLAKLHKLRVLDRVTAHDASGQTKVTQTTITIKLPPKHR